MAHRILEVLHYAAWICALMLVLFNMDDFYWGIDKDSFIENLRLEKIIGCLVAVFGILIIPAPFWYIVAKKWYLLPWQHKND